ncbi:hypothetical protein F5X68DRAFT_211241 [Plectosphaerella plurivora]|uniref:Uncharacterized protein n=1 Tax=Plectosphaerella plurivora TaxID=936078 RepID=A0A9P8V839_9PEZI|nr:hypothetical protein F5X68DRAFT_211241 [Plectosphaerella plurivora]
MLPTYKTTAALSLSLLVALGQAKITHNCDASTSICLTTFRWCDTEPCQYPKNVKPLVADLSTTAGYGMLLFHEFYDVIWTTPSQLDEVLLTWYIPPLSIEGSEGPPLEWTRNTTYPHIQFCPDDVVKELVESKRYNVTEGDIRTMMTDIGNHIVIQQVDSVDSETPSGSPAQTAQFSVQNGWAWQAASAAEVIGASNEKRKWRIGVGVGVGIGLPLLLTITGLTTWRATKRRMTGQEKAT